MSVVGGNPRCKREKRDSDNLPGLGGLGMAWGWRWTSKPLAMESCGASIDFWKQQGVFCWVVGIALGIAWLDPGERCRVIAKAGWTWARRKDRRRAGQLSGKAESARAAD